MKKTLIIGLGNPGKEFQDTYHNVGFLALDSIAGSGMPVFKKHKNLFEYAVADNVIFIRPLTFMNESGAAVKEAMKKFDVKPNQIIVIHDESDLNVGNFKISSGKNAAGHRGVQSIIDQIHTNAFTRVRIGIRPVHEAKRKKASDFVLTKITPANRMELEKIFGEFVQKLKDGLPTAS